MSNWNLFITRHWETESNITKAIVGITDVWLTNKWKQDAHFIWANTNKNIDLIITSPQTRAIHSAEIIRKYHGIPIVEHPLLHPQDFWIIEWLTLDEARKEWLWQHLHSKDTNKYLHKAKWWESAEEMETRNFFKNVSEPSADQEHGEGSILWCFRWLVVIEITYEF